MTWTIPKSGGGKTEKPPAGNHLAVLVGLFDMGRQWQEPFTAGETGYYAWRAYFVWELTGEKIAGTDKNHVIAIDLSLSTNPKAKLHKWVLARTGKPPVEPFDPTTELGQFCLLNVVMKGDYPKIDGMAAVPAVFAKSLPKPSYPVTAVSLAEFRAGAAIPEWVPYLYGSPLEEHIRACEQIGCPRPQPKKKVEPARAQAGHESEPDSADAPF